MRRNPLLALTLAVAAGACTMERPSQDDDPELRYESARVPAEDAQAVTEASTEAAGAGPSAYETGTPTPPMGVPDARGGQTVTGRFVPVNNNPINASVTVSGVGTAGTLVSVAVYDADPNTAFRASIARGPCGNTGPEVAPLEMRFQSGAGGQVAASDTVNLPAATVLNGQHVVLLKPASAGPSTPPVACAPLPTTQPDARP